MVMKVRFWIPGNLAYGDKPTPPGAPSGVLVFDVELLGISRPTSCGSVSCEECSQTCP